MLAAAAGLSCPAAAPAHLSDICHILGLKQLLCAASCSTQPQGLCMDSQLHLDRLVQCRSCILQLSCTFRSRSVLSVPPGELSTSCATTCMQRYLLLTACNRQGPAVGPIHNYCSGWMAPNNMVPRLAQGMQLLRTDRCRTDTAVTMHGPAARNRGPEHTRPAAP